MGTSPITGGLALGSNQDIVHIVLGDHIYPSYKSHSHTDLERFKEEDRKLVVVGLKLEGS